MNKKEELIEQISGLFVYYGLEISPVILKIYITALSDYPTSDIKKAVSYFIKNSDKMPTVSNFINYINAGGLSLDDRAEISWSLVLKAVKKYSWDKSFTFRDKAIRKALEIVGYDNIRQCLESELNWKKAEFVNIYKTFTKLNQDSYAAPEYFAGLIELNNPPLGIEEKAGIYIGKSVYIVEDGIRVKRDALPEFLKLAGGQNEYKKLQ